MKKILNKATHCKHCGIEFGTINKKGRIVNYYANDLCRACYIYLYNQKYNIDNENYIPRVSIKTTHCLECGREFGVDLNALGNPLKLHCKGLCNSCYTILYRNKKKLPKVKKEPKPKPKPKPKKQTIEEGIHLEREYKERLRKLLNRFKYGVYNKVDIFELVNYYMDFSYKLYFNKSLNYQIVEMLKLLKNIYDNDKG